MKAAFGIDAALRDLSTAELTVLAHRGISLSKLAAEAGRPRVAHLFHVLAVMVAEEGDRRREVLDGLATDLEPVELGAIVDASTDLDLDGWAPS